MRIEFPKNKYSESAIRRSLYWLSQYCQWNLSEDDNNWVIGLVDSKNEEKDRANLHRLINDHLLRDEIDKQTGQLRRAIIYKALSDIESSL